MTEQQLARISALAQKSRTPDGLTQAERDVYKRQMLPFSFA